MLFLELELLLATLKEAQAAFNKTPSFIQTSRGKWDTIRQDIHKYFPIGMMCFSHELSKYLKSTTVVYLK